MRKKIWGVSLVSLSLLITLGVSFVTNTDFTPSTYASEEPVLSFPVLSDIHVEAGDNPTTQRTQEHLKAALQDLNTINPRSDTMVINGDLGDGRQADYNTLSQILKQTPHPPIHYTIGNHEFYQALYDQEGTWSPSTFPNDTTEQESISRFLNFTGQNKLYYDDWIKGYHFIFLGSEHYRQYDASIGNSAYLSQDQLQWLDQTLKAKNDPQKPVFVFLHQGLPNTVAGTSGADYQGVVQANELTQILSKYPQVNLFTSHTHTTLQSPQTEVKDGFTMINTSSVFEPYNENDQPAPSTESQGLYVTVYTDHVEVQGRDFYRKSWIPQADFNIPINK
jgi:3',5'-cyclic-AMP phosphodiesterase